MNSDSLYGLSPVVIYKSFNVPEEHVKIKSLYHRKFQQYGFDVGMDSRYSGVSNSSGESLGKCFLHKDSDYDGFFYFLKDNLNNYFYKLGFNSDLFSFHILKSWYVVITDNNGMDFHTHSCSDLSFCYYVDIPKNSGKINFLNQNFNNKNNFFSGLFDYNPNEPEKTFIKDFTNPHVFKSYAFEPSEGMLLIFPSDLSHSVDWCDESITRYSISGDIKLTLNKNILNFESGLIHPSCWREL